VRRNRTPIRNIPDENDWNQRNQSTTSEDLPASISVTVERFPWSAQFHERNMKTTLTAVQASSGKPQRTILSDFSRRVMNPEDVVFPDRPFTGSMTGNWVGQQA
jgi:hypothetical protein